MNFARGDELHLPAVAATTGPSSLGSGPSSLVSQEVHDGRELKCKPKATSRSKRIHLLGAAVVGLVAL
jgi:hypothetical protein